MSIELTPLQLAAIELGKLIEYQEKFSELRIDHGVSVGSGANFQSAIDFKVKNPHLFPITPVDQALAMVSRLIDLDSEAEEVEDELGPDAASLDRQTCSEIRSTLQLQGYDVDLLISHLLSNNS